VKNRNILIAWTLVFTTSLFVSVQVSAQTAFRGILGLNRPNLNWSGAGGDALIDKAAGCGKGMASIRLGFKITDSTTRARMIDYIQHCNAIGVSVLLELSMQNPVYYPAGTTQRAGNNSLPVAYRFSDLNPNLFETEIISLLNDLHNAGVVLRGIELGNEFNWAGYNGDLPVYSSSGSDYKIISSSTPWADPDFVNYRSGLSKYGTCFYRLSHQANTIFGLNVVRRITGGTADVPDSWVQSSRSSKCTPELTLQLLEGSNPNQPVGTTNYFAYAAGIGVHIYPAGAVSTLAATTTAISDEITPIQNTILSTLPFWITECGYPRARFANEDDRLTQHLTFMQALNTMAFPLGAVYLYTLDISAGYAVYDPSTDTYFPTSQVFENYY